MTGLILLHKGILGHFMQKDTKKHDFWDLMLLILEHVAFKVPPAMSDFGAKIIK